MIEMVTARRVHIIGLFFSVMIVSIAIMGQVSETKEVVGVHIPIYSQVYKGCFYVRHFGIECPTCGLTRSFYAFFDGEFLLAYHYNIMVIPLVFTMAWMMLNSLYFVVKNAYHPWIVRILWINVGLLAVTLVIRIIEFVNHIINI